MYLNPFHPNYLNQMSFQKGNQRSPRTPKCQASAQKSTRRVKEFNAQQTFPRPGKLQLSAKFTLNNYLNASHLHYTQQGYLLAYLKRDKSISGRSFILFPQGIISYCNVVNRKLSGWISICKKGQFYNISHFSAGKIHGVQYTYDIKCGLTVESLYQCGVLQSVKRGVADSQTSFQRCLKNKQLINLLHDTLNYSFYDQYLPKVESSLGNYYGSKIKDIPNGLGVLVTDQEIFYGNYSYGLLSGEGVMIYPNGNAYIGEFQEGIMRGYGSLLNKGNYLHKFNDTIISENEVKRNKNILPFAQSQQLSSIFGPIIDFYHKLNQIYQNRRKKLVSQQQISFVDIQVQQNEQQPQKESKEENSSSSYLYSPKEQNFTQMFHSKNNYSKEIGPTFGIPQRSQQLQNIKSSIKQVRDSENNNKKEEEIEKKEKTKNKKGSKAHKSSKQKWLIKDHQWQEIIEQLGQENVSKQDDFLNPQQERVNTDDQFQLKKNPLNSRISPQHGIKLTEQPQQIIDRLQNQLIRKIEGKK